jgi:hypothetical protein
MILAYEDFEYEVEEVDYRSILEELDKKELIDYILDNIDYSDIEEDFYDKIKEYYESEADEWFRESKMDIYDYYGVSRKDFI